MDDPYFFSRWWKLRISLGLPNVRTSTSKSLWDLAIFHTVCPEAKSVMIWAFSSNLVHPCKILNNINCLMTYCHWYAHRLTSRRCLPYFLNLNSESWQYLLDAYGIAVTWHTNLFLVSSMPLFWLNLPKIS